MKKFFSIIFDQTSQTTMVQQEGCYVYENNQFQITVLGHIRTALGINNGQEIANLFLTESCNITQSLKGLYILIIWDKEQKALSIFHDRVTSPISVYYTEKNGQIFISTSLKKLLTESSIDRKLNESKIGEFLANGRIIGKETLIKKVFKMEAMKGLQINSDGARQFNIEYNQPKYSLTEGVQKWKQALDDSIDECTELAKDFCITLSSGYDSNYIASRLNATTSHPIQAITLGGESGRNEIPVVQEISKSYENIKLSTSHTSASSLDSFPEIVWRLEGAMTEIGIFLQYELAKEISRLGHTKLICGECADEAMDPNFYTIESELQKENSAYNSISMKYHSFLFAHLIVLKKNGILENSFGIETFYPYLNDDFLAVAEAVSSINLIDKRFHKALCTQILKPEISKQLAKIPGTTELHSLFKDSNEIKKFFKKITDSSFYKSHQAIIADIFREDFQKASLKQRLRLKGREIFRTILHDTNYFNNKKKEAYKLEERKLDRWFYIAYLILFQELFISGRFDNEMNNEKFEHSIKEFL